jgi:hypothetical protein
MAQRVVRFAVSDRIKMKARKSDAGTNGIRFPSNKHGSDCHRALPGAAVNVTGRSPAREAGLMGWNQWPIKPVTERRQQLAPDTVGV